MLKKNLFLLLLATMATGVLFLASGITRPTHAPSIDGEPIILPTNTSATTEPSSPSSNPPQQAPHPQTSTRQIPIEQHQQVDTYQLPHDLPPHTNYTDDDADDLNDEDEYDEGDDDDD